MLRIITLLFLFFNVIPLFAANTDTPFFKLNKAVTAINKADYNTSMQILLEVERDARSEGDSTVLFLSRNNMGNLYMSTLNYGEALECFLEAYTIAGLLKDTEKEMTVLNNIGIVYAQDNNLKKSEEFILKAYNLAVRLKKIRQKYVYAVNLGELKNNMGSNKEAIPYFERVISHTTIQDRIYENAYLGLSKSYFELREYQRSIDVIQKFLRDDFKLHLKQNRVYFLLQAAKSYYALGAYKLSFEYAQKALKGNIDKDEFSDLYELLSKLFLQKGNYEKAIQLKDSATNYSIEANRLKMSKLFEGSKLRLEMINYQNELTESNSRLNFQHKLILIISIGGVFIVLLLLRLLYANKIRSQQRKEIYRYNQELSTLKLRERESQNKILEQELKEKETVALLEQEKLKNQIEQRNRELLAKTLYLSNRNELLQKIIYELQQGRSINASETISEKIKNLQALIKSEDEWNFFVKHFEEVNQGFLNRLRQKHPELNSKDIRFISYVYMNLNLKEIAAILCITHDAVRKRKERVSKKMGIKNDGLDSYISTI
ncbi:MAG: tetratricopeptide repeat protein [Bacteroidales bacterium]